MRVNVTYTSSNGHAYDFQVGKLKIKEANFHEWEYEPDVLERRFGEKVLRFNKEAVEYETQLYVYGSEQYRRDALTAMHVAFEHDIRQNTPGRLVWGASYIDCFIIASSTYPQDNQSRTTNDIKIYAPFPFWIEPKEYQFYPSDDDTPSLFLDYDYGYDYDYSSPGVGTQQIINDSPGTSPFEMIIYGPAVNPYFYIGSNYYTVATTVQSGEYLTINSRNKTVYRTTNDGEQINEFNNRGKTSSIFEPVPEGTQLVIWPATFGMTLTLLKERSEPVWS